MIAEMIAGGVLLAAAVSGWIAAFRARGAENDAHGRARLAEGRADAADDRAANAEADRDATIGELKAKEVALQVATQSLERARRQKAELLAKLTAAGVPVAPDVLDGAIERLHANKDRVHQSPPGGDTRDPGRPMSHDDPNALIDPREEG